MRKINKIQFLFLIFFGFFFSFKTEAALLYLKTSSTKYHLGDIFLVDLKIDTQKEKINAAQVEIIFPKEKLRAIDIVKENSIFTLWPEDPSFSNEEGKISFVGGLPLGFEGEGKILSIAFEVISKKSENGEINFSEECLVLLNDGFGKKANLETKSINLFFYPEPAENPRNELKNLLEKDVTPPEPFEIFLVKSNLVFEGKYFISFFAIDFQSGIDHYEIEEGNFLTKTKQNFYVLRDQNLKSEIKVKAVDKAGNVKISFLKLK